jgi:hypothetical protein
MGGNVATEKPELPIVVPVIDAGVAIEEPPQPVERFIDEAFQGRQEPPAVEQVDLSRMTRFLDAASADSQGSTFKTGPGVLKRVVIGTAPAGTDGVLTVRDGLQGGGRIIARITAVQNLPVSLNFDAQFNKGLNVTLTGATPGSWTIIYE